MKVSTCTSKNSLVQYEDTLIKLSQKSKPEKASVNQKPVETSTFSKLCTQDEDSTLPIKRPFISMLTNPNPRVKPRIDTPVQARPISVNVVDQMKTPAPGSHVSKPRKKSPMDYFNSKIQKQ